MARNHSTAHFLGDSWHGLAAVAAASCLAAAALVGCGADTGLSGAALLTDTSTSGGAEDGYIANPDGGAPIPQDAAPIQQDGGTATQPEVTIVGDTIIEQDGGVIGPADTGPVLPPDQSCAGKCGQAKPNQWTCQCDNACAKYDDCCGDYEQLCTSVGPGPGPNPTELVACLSKACPQQISQCKNLKTCGAFWSCAQSCADQACLEKCTSGLNVNQLAQEIQPLMSCGQQANCLAGTDPPPTGPICGDGKCEQPENSLNCPKDCPNTPPGAAQVCLSQKCPSQYKGCFGDPACVAAVACMNNGGSPKQCAQNDPKVGQELGAMLDCGQKNGCLNTAPQPVCGNGKCEAGETAQTCAKDCSPVVPPTDPITKCLAANCTDAYNTCAASPACMAAAQCLLNGGGMAQCVKDMQTGQVVLSLVNCGNKVSCFSNTQPPGSCAGLCGKLSPNSACQCDANCAANGNCCSDYKTLCGTTTTTSCQGKCGQYDVNAKCQCNVSCSQFGDCCPDYQKVCGSTGPVCGDGVCTPPESATSCPKDCSVVPPAKPCKTKADCSATEICCGKADGSQVCATAGQCF